MSPELGGQHNEGPLVCTKGSASVHCLYRFDAYQIALNKVQCRNTIYGISTIEAIMLTEQYDRLLLVIHNTPHGIYVP
jgi:hypothetical protein